MRALAALLLFSAYMTAQSAVQIFVNQVGFERLGPKSAIVLVPAGEPEPSTFEIVGSDGATSFRGKLDGRCRSPIGLPTGRFTRPTSPDSSQKARSWLGLPVYRRRRLRSTTRTNPSTDIDILRISSFAHR